MCWMPTWLRRTKASSVCLKVSSNPIVTDHSLYHLPVVAKDEELSSNIPWSLRSLINLQNGRGDIRTVNPGVGRIQLFTFLKDKRRFLVKLVVLCSRKQILGCVRTT